MKTYVALDVRSILSKESIRQCMSATGLEKSSAETLIRGNFDREVEGFKTGLVSINDQEVVGFSAVGMKIDGGVPTGVIARTIVGTERDVVAQFAHFFSKIFNDGDPKQARISFPVIITSDGGAHSIRSITNATLRLRSADRKSTQERTPEESANFSAFDSVLGQLFDSSDKWKKNYLNPNAESTFDIKQKCGFTPDAVWNFGLTERYVADDEMKKLAELSWNVASRTFLAYANIFETTPGAQKLPDKLFSDAFLAKIFREVSYKAKDGVLTRLFPKDSRGEHDESENAPVVPDSETMERG